MGKCIWDRPTTGKYHCEINRAWIAKDECWCCPDYKEETMELQKLYDIYEEYLKNNNLEKAIEIMGEIARFKRAIDPDWKDIIEEFNRRLSNG